MTTADLIMRLVPLTVQEGIVRHSIKCGHFSIPQVIEQRVLGSE